MQDTWRRFQLSPEWISYCNSFQNNFFYSSIKQDEKDSFKEFAKKEEMIQIIEFWEQVHDWKKMKQGTQKVYLIHLFF